MDPMLIEVENNGHGNALPLYVTDMVLHSSTSIHKQVTNMDKRLHRAVTFGSLQHLESVVGEGKVILHQVTPLQHTSLHIAAGLGHLEVVQYIHNESPTLFVRANSLGETPLHRAARAGHFNIVKFLINCAKNSSPSKDIEIGRVEAVDLLSKANVKGNTLMHEAVRNGHLEVVKLLIEEAPELLSMGNYAGESPLHMAVEKGDFHIVNQLLKSLHVSYEGPNGRTALHAAVIHQRPDIAELLLEKNPGLVEDVDDNMRTPLHFASALGFLDSVKMLLNYDTSTTCFFDKFGYAPIHLAARFGRVDIIEEFILIQPDIIDLLDQRGRNILHIAVECVEVGVVESILKKDGMEELVNGMDCDGNTPLHQAASIGNPYMVIILLQYKRIDVTALNGNRETAAAIAVRKRRESNQHEQEARVMVLARLLSVANRLTGNHPSYLRLMSHGSMANGESIKSLQEKVSTLLVVATLVATVTFAVGFTLPGGYHSDGPRQGMATLQHFESFGSFIMFDSMGMLFSLGAVVSLIWLQFARKDFNMAAMLFLAQLFTTIAIASMTMAFATGVKLTVSESTWFSLTMIDVYGYVAYFITFLSLSASFYWRVLQYHPLVIRRVYGYFGKVKDNVSVLFHYDV